MTPDDFILTDHWRQGTRGPNRDGRRPIYTLHHPEDQAFVATVTLHPPSWSWSVAGRVAYHGHGYKPRKRQAMHAAIAALKEAYDRSK